VLLKNHFSERLFGPHKGHLLELEGSAGCVSQKVVSKVPMLLRKTSQSEAIVSSPITPSNSITEASNDKENTNWTEMKPAPKTRAK
jgi:hypothetical protein